MSTIATYPVPSPARIEAARVEMEGKGRILRAAMEYARESAVQIDGLTVRMPVASARSLLEVAVKHGVVLPLAVEADEVDHARAQAAKYAAFRAYCAEDGHDGAQRIEAGALSQFGLPHTCDSCQTAGRAGVMQYAPDAMGFPTPVLFTCDECRAPKA